MRWEKSVVNSSWMSRWLGFFFFFSLKPLWSGLWWMLVMYCLLLLLHLRSHYTSTYDIVWQLKVEMRKIILAWTFASTIYKLLLNNLAVSVWLCGNRKGGGRELEILRRSSRLVFEGDNLFTIMSLWQQVG